MILPSDANSEKMGAEESSLSQGASMDSCPVEERGDNNDCGGKQSQQLSLDTLKAQLESLETELQNKDRKLEELQKECGALEKDLDEKNEEAADLRRLWKKTAKELDKVRANNQGFYQITDEYLIEQINHLRISIRDFSIQYFDGKCSPKRGLTIYRPSYRRLLESTTSKRYLDDYIRSPVNCHQVVQSFLWKVVVEEILDSFEWAGRGSSEHFRQMWKELGPRLSSQGRLMRPDPETERRFQVWRATTTALFLDRVDSKRVDSDLKRKTAEHVDYIVNTIRDLCRKEDEKGIKDQLSTIVTQAIRLDKEISRQTARVMWTFNVFQEVETGDHAQRPREIGLVIAPAVFKRGKSTGEDFNQETVLLEAVVSYRG